MKRMNYVIAILLMMSLSSCVKSIENRQEKTIKSEFELTEALSVPLKEGFITKVTQNGDVIALSDRAMLVYAEKSGSVQTEFISYADMPEFQKETGISESNSVLMFEDSYNGDYDYNDVVLYVKHRLKQIKGVRYFDVYVKPIALGSTKRLVFGY